MAEPQDPENDAASGPPEQPPAALDASDQTWMDQALHSAQSMLGRTWPNPAVGCAIVKDVHLIAVAATAAGGRPHAETQALTLAGDAAAGATAYVTLEPCSHHGLTPPCADALIGAKLGRVVIATLDPDERVRGNGVARLQAAGIEVHVGCQETEARRLNIGFFSRVAHGTPWCCIDRSEPQAVGRLDKLRLFDARLLYQATARAARGQGDWGLDLAPHHRVLLVGSRADAATLHLAANSTGSLWILHGLGASASDLEADPAAAQIWRDAPRQALGCLDQLEQTLADDDDDAGRRLFQEVLESLGTLGMTRLICDGRDSIAPILTRLALARGVLADFTDDRGRHTCREDDKLVDRALGEIHFHSWQEPLSKES